VNGPAAEQRRPEVRLRAMEKADLPAVLAIERAVFPEDAWTEEMLDGELAGQGDVTWYLVAVDAGGAGPSGDSGTPDEAPWGNVAGYAGLFAPGGGQGDVQTIAVRAERQGEGIGGKLLDALISEAEARGCREVFLDVRAGNAVARRLYRRTGFTDVGVRRGYYQPSGADAIVMRLKLPRARDAAAPSREPGQEGSAR
jgi:[ribosomal protein S18]-alanine N-acetyltransferase